jgi:hypothetical protein
MNELPTGCLPLAIWHGLYNVTDAEANGSAVVRLGLPTFVLRPCRCKDESVELFNDDPFSLC